MTSITIEKKRKNIDLPVDTLKKLSVMAAAQGKSLKVFIESLLVKKAEDFNEEIQENPSPGSDPYFADIQNMQEIEKRVKNPTEPAVTLKTAEEITHFIQNL